MANTDDLYFLDLFIRYWSQNGKNKPSFWVQDGVYNFGLENTIEKGIYESICSGDSLENLILNLRLMYSVHFISQILANKKI